MHIDFILICFPWKKWHGKLKRCLEVGHYVIPSMLQTTFPPLIRNKWSLTNTYYVPDLHLSDNELALLREITWLLQVCSCMFHAKTMLVRLVTFHLTIYSLNKYLLGTELGTSLFICSLREGNERHIKGMLFQSPAEKKYTLKCENEDFQAALRESQVFRLSPPSKHQPTSSLNDNQTTLHMPHLIFSMSFLNSLGHFSKS